MTIQKIIQVVVFVIIVITLAGCSSIGISQSPTPDYNLFVLDPVFREIYAMLGGEEVLGEVISEVEETGGVKRQYVVSGMLVYDSTAPDGKWFQFGNLAKDFGIVQAPEAEKGVAEPFKEMYRRLGGDAFIDKPLTGLVFNAEKKRWEQYFEDLGFYVGQESDGEVRLLPYGLWKCGEDCRGFNPRNGLPEVPKPSPQPNTPVAEPEIPTVLPTLEITASAAIDQVSSPEAEPSEWALMIWDKIPNVMSGQAQQIGVEVFKNNRPAEGINLDLSVLMPDNSTPKFYFGPTNEIGYASIQLPPIAAESGAMILFTVCITTETGERYCLVDRFQISPEG